MHLWTEYEGNTLAGYPLGRLTRSEGRSAFFATTTPDGKPALLRLTESHFDDRELINRWQKIAAVKHPNLQAIGHSGQITFDGVALACCLLEPVDMSLTDVLRERALTVDEAREVAESVAGALTALHAAGLIHEHLDATNVFAHGETVKLRSDCARECLGDFEADTAEARDALRQRDVHDLGLLLLRCLAVEWPNTTATPIPAPFDRIVPRALDGTLTAAGMVDALEALKPAPITPRPAPVPAATPGPQAIKAAAAVPATPRPTGTAATPAAVLAAIADRAQPAPAPVAKEVLLRHEAGTHSNGDILLKFKPMRAGTVSPRTWIASGAAALMLGIVLWNTAFSKHPAPAQQPVAAVQAAPQPAAAPQPKPSATTAQRNLFTTGAQAGWRVIAYTYNQEEQARAKATQIRSRYATLHPQVFSPTGHAPYFVALGGPSDAASALSLRNRARHAGLPRDTYARNF